MPSASILRKALRVARKMSEARVERPFHLVGALRGRRRVFPFARVDKVVCFGRGGLCSSSAS
jgi:hypothetical protein